MKHSLILKFDGINDDQETKYAQELGKKIKESTYDYKDSLKIFIETETDIEQNTGDLIKLIFENILIAIPIVKELSYIITDWMALRSQKRIFLYDTDGKLVATIENIHSVEDIQQILEKHYRHLMV